MARLVSLLAGWLRTHTATGLAVVVLFAAPFAIAETAETPGAETLEPDSGAELLDRAFRNLYAEDYIQTLVLATQSRGGKVMRRRLQLTRRQSVRPGKALLRFLYPQSIRRTSVLILENARGSDDLYVYLPATRMTRHLSNAQRADAFFGTDLSYEDVEPKRVEDFVVRRLEPEEIEAPVGDDGSECVQLEIRAAIGFESVYDKQISCLETERGIILWTDYYAKGRHLKRLVIDPKEVRRVGDRHIPFLITIETPRQRSKTSIITEDYDLRAEIPDKIFNTWNLEAGDAKGDRRKTTAAPTAPLSVSAGSPNDPDEGE